MKQRTDSINLRIALQRLGDALPVLIGPKGWTRSSEEVTELVDTLMDSDRPGTELRAASRLVNILAHFPAARERVRREMAVVDVLRGQMETGLREFPTCSDFDEDVLQLSMCLALEAIDADVDWPDSISDDQRVVLVSPETGKSIKLKNVRFNLEKLAELAGGTIMAGAAVVGMPNPIVIAAGVLLVACGIGKTVTIRLSEQDAGVFWGLILAGHGDGCATAEDILSKTNRMRRLYGLGEFDQVQVQRSLNKLATIGSIRAVEGQERRWHIVEEYMVA